MTTKSYSLSDDLCDPVTAFGQRIAGASMGSQLHAIAEELKHTIGITDLERAALNEAISARFSHLNYEALGPQVQRKPGETLKR